MKKKYGKKHKSNRRVALGMYGKVCMCCGRDEYHGASLHADHIYPIAIIPSIRRKLENYQILCDKCNISKGANYIKDYRYEERNVRRYSTETKKYIESIYYLKNIWDKRVREALSKQDYKYTEESKLISKKQKYIRFKEGYQKPGTILIPSNWDNAKNPKPYFNKDGYNRKQEVIEEIDFVLENENILDYLYRLRG